MIGSITWKHWLVVGVLLAVAACGCGSSSIVTPPDGTCVNMGNATYVGTENVVVNSGPCPGSSNLAVTFTVVQAAGSCNFTLRNSQVSDTTFAGTVSDSHVSWTGSYPSASGRVTINTVTATLSADLKTLSGNFTWTYAGNTHCTGTTTFNVVKQD